MNLSGVEDVLREWIGLDATTVGTAALARAVRDRMASLRMDDVETFLEAVRADPAERDRLVEEVIVAESWFFRDQQVFKFVADYSVTRSILPGRGPVRILSAPCASGEEPYSAAMALLDAGLEPSRFEIDAIDISHVALDRARRARYTANAFRNADSSCRDRWFRLEGSAAVLHDRVRACVHFAWANLLAPGFADGREPYDVIFCRNLLIYLTPEARGTVQRTLDRLLQPDGILVLGAAEPPIMRGDWIPAGEASVFALRRGVHVSSPLRRAAFAAPGERPPPSQTTDRPPQRADPAEAAVASPKPVPPSLSEILERAGSLANDRRHLEALEVCERARAGLPPAPELFFLMGMLHQSLGDGDRAEGCFHKTLYLDAGHEEALLALALLARQRGDLRMAETYRQSAARVLARKAAP